MEDEIMSEWDMPTSPEEQEIKWNPWKKKFAVLPKKVPGGKVWLGTYYERTGRNLYATYKQWGTLFDIIKAEQ